MHELNTFLSNQYVILPIHTNGTECTCARAHTHVHTYTKVKTEYPPVSLRSLVKNRCQMNRLRCCHLGASLVGTRNHVLVGVNTMPPSCDVASWYT